MGRPRKAVVKTRADNGQPMYDYRTVRVHPLAPASGRLAIHRAVLFEAIGYGPHLCHWCGRHINWQLGSTGGHTLVVDHLDDDSFNNHPKNLAPSCNGCNSTRNRFCSRSCARRAQRIA